LLARLAGHPANAPAMSGRGGQVRYGALVARLERLARALAPTHGAVAATVATLEGAWAWRASDRLLHVLPLDHTHGLLGAPP
jgi:hypothetical protein